jgi:hypothetical protein
VRTFRENALAVQLCLGTNVIADIDRTLVAIYEIVQKLIRT